MRMFRKSSGGFTFIELVVTTAVILILASASLPLIRVSIRRQREAELKADLRIMRAAIDKFKDYADTGRIAATELQFGSENYPASLQQLVDGVPLANDASGRKMKFLRRIPIDPLTNSTDWGLRAYQDMANCDGLGRAERLRRLLEGGRQGTRRHEVQGLVSHEVNHSQQGGGRLDADRAAGRDLADHDPLVDRDGVVSQLDRRTRRKPRCRSDLMLMRDAIDQYYADKGKYPESLDALVSESYLRTVPKDPFTDSTTSWQTTEADAPPGTVSTTSPGIFEVKSGSQFTALDGSRYADW